MASKVPSTVCWELNLRAARARDSATSTSTGPLRADGRPPAASVIDDYGRHLTRPSHSVLPALRALMQLLRFRRDFGGLLPYPTHRAWRSTPLSSAPSATPVRSVATLNATSAVIRARWS